MSVDNKIEYYKIILTSIGLILTVGTLLFGIVRYNKEKKHQFQKSFYETQLDIYMKVANHVANINTLQKSSKLYKKHVREFKKYYIGQMCIIEDKKVEQRMVQYNTILDWYNEAEIDSESEQILDQLLTHLTLILNHTFRNSSISTWKINSDFLEEFSDYTNTHEKDVKLIEICEKLILTDSFTWQNYNSEKKNKN